MLVQRPVYIYIFIHLQYVYIHPLRLLPTVLILEYKLEKNILYSA